MTTDGAEAEDLAKLAGALVINIGTASADDIPHYLRAVRAYNRLGAPVLLDPVGAGATSLRRNAVQTILSGGCFQVIKGNESEILTILQHPVGAQKGVNSTTSRLTGPDKARAVKKLAARERNVVVMTGLLDYVSDGERVYVVANGHPLLQRITGSGCTLGTTIAACVAVETEDRLLAGLAGLLLFELAAQRAGERPAVKGPGTFVPAFVDELADISRQADEEDATWMQRASVTPVDV